MIKLFNNIRLDTTENFTFVPESIYVKTLPENTESNVYFPQTFDKEIQRAIGLGNYGSVKHVVSSIEELEGEKSDVLKYLHTLLKPSLEGNKIYPYFSDFVIFADKENFLNILMRTWKTLFPKASYEDFKALFEDYKKSILYIITTINNNSRSLEYLKAIFEEGLPESKFSEAKAFTTDMDLFEIAPLEFQLLSVLLNPDHTKKKVFEKNYLRLYEHRILHELAYCKSNFGQRIGLLHEYYPEVFNGKEAFNMGEDELKSYIKTIWKGQENYFYDQTASHNLINSGEMAREKIKYDMRTVCEVLLDYDYRGRKVQLPEHLQGTFDDLIHWDIGPLYLYVKNDGRLNVQDLLDFERSSIRNTTVTQVFSNHYGAPSVLLFKLFRSTNHEALKPFYIE